MLFRWVRFLSRWTCNRNNTRKYRFRRTSRFERSSFDNEENSINRAIQKQRSCCVRIITGVENVVIYHDPCPKGIHFSSLNDQLLINVYKNKHIHRSRHQAGRHSKPYAVHFSPRRCIQENTVVRRRHINQRQKITSSTVRR